LCDFPIWTPTKFYIERIEYGQKIIEDAISKARIFYFTVFLPSDNDLPFIEQLSIPIVTETVKFQTY